jgi:hypothetical protein
LVCVSRCVLADSVLTLYSGDEAGRTMDLEQKKGSLSLVGCTLSIIDPALFQFQIKHIGDKHIVLRAADAGDLSAWMYVLQTALKNTAQAGIVTDTGTAFVPVKIASSATGKKSSQLNLNIEVVLEKTENGFGIVIESTPRGILVKDRNPTISMLSIIPQSAGQVQVGDRLLKIDDQDVHDWTISSIIEHIGNDRIPVKRSARFAFARKHHCMAIRPLAERAHSEHSLGSPRTPRSGCSSPGLPATPREVSD